MRRYYLKKYTTPFFLVSLLVFLVSLLLFVLANLSPELADTLNDTVSYAMRRMMAAMTSWIPFSLGEWLLLSVPLLLIILFVVLFAFCDTARRRAHLFANVLGAVLLIGSLYFLTLGIAYHTTPLDERLGIETDGATAEELYDTAVLMLRECEALLPDISFDEKGYSVMPYTMDELSEIISADYDRFEQNYGIIRNFESRVKSVGISKVMSYAHLLGIYSSFTGEANINVDYPDADMPFTTAHEFAHQRGIGRENEANFVAFLVTKDSEDVYVRYTAYFNMYQYLANALWRANPERYYDLIKEIDPRIRKELIALSEHSKQYTGSKLGELSTTVNDSYLKFNGVTEGSASYGLVVDLAVSYYRDSISG